MAHLAASATRFRAANDMAGARATMECASRLAFADCALRVADGGLAHRNGFRPGVGACQRLFAGEKSRRFRAFRHDNRSRCGLDRQRRVARQSTFAATFGRTGNLAGRSHRACDGADRFPDFLVAAPHTDSHGDARASHLADLLGAESLVAPSQTLDVRLKSENRVLDVVKARVVGFLILNCRAATPLVEETINVAIGIGIQNAEAIVLQRC